MRFRRHAPHEEPELNMIPMIDVVLVVLMFLMATTTFSRYAELQIDLPSASGSSPDKQKLVQIAVTSKGDYLLDGKPARVSTVVDLAERLRQVTSSPETQIEIVADNATPYQAVINAMSAAQQAGLSRISFVTEQP